jgi:recombinational DNA repair protein (RecF pathway)
LALCELYAGVVPEGDPLGAEAYGMLLESLESLQHHPEPLVALTWCEMRLLEWSGFCPSLEYAVDDGRRLDLTEVWVSPEAGGFVSTEGAAPYADRFPAAYEVLVGLARTSELDAPPPRLKRNDECLLTLFPFWRSILNGPLPANESLLGELRHRLSQSQE